ncbi:6-bladed beta-propeller [Parabacteroides sp. OttesenSCG-928-G06]|nr:6-bladed beta-propeller [Parabacteroides sp. OttesenSCG-928-G06]
MKHILFFMFLLLPLSSWSQDRMPVAKKKKQGAKEVISINLYTAYQKSLSSLPLSRFVEEIEYLPLETTDDCLLSEGLNIISVTEKEIIVFDYERGYRFDRQGKFLNAIGRKGQGPGEFISCLALAADTLNRWVYFADNKHILKYDYEGNHLENLPTQAWATVMVLNKPDDLVMENFNYPYAEAGKRYSVYAYNPLKKEYIYKVSCDKKERIPLAMVMPSIYSYKEEVYIKDFWEDIVYKVSNATQLEPHIKFEKGKFIERDSDDESLFTGKQSANDKKIISVQTIAETDRYICMCTTQGNLLYDKKQKETLMVNYSDPNHTLLNDLYGSPNFPSGYGFPGKIIGNYMYGACHPHILINNRDQKHSVSGQKYADYQKMIDNLDPEGNHVLVILKLKE